MLALSGLTGPSALCLVNPLSHIAHYLPVPDDFPFVKGRVLLINGLIFK